MGAIAVAGFISWEEGNVKKVVKETLQQHEAQPVARAHPDIKEGYVSKRELNGSLHKIQRRLDSLTSQQKQVLERLPRKRHWSHIVHDLDRRRGGRRRNR